jgi:lipopolysaccharide/colanic/teichoic acid biosynthesis glycosyltransferase
MTAAPETAARREPRPPAPRRRRPETPTVLRPGLDAAAATVVGVVAGLPGPLAAGYGAATVLGLAADRAYRPRITTEIGLRVPRLAVAAALPLPVLVLVAGGPPRVAVTVVAATALLLTVLHAATAAAERACRRRGGGEPALVVGAGATGRRLARAMAAHPELGLRPVGLLDDASPPSGDGDGCPVLIGGPADLPRLVAELGVTRVVVAMPARGPDGAPARPPDARPDDGAAVPAEAELAEALRAVRDLGARVWVVPRLDGVGLDVPLGRFDDLWGTPLIALRGAEGTPARRARRAVEVVLAGALLLVTGPAVLATAALTRWTALVGRGPAFFHQWRLSRRGELVRIAKIRTLAHGGDEEWAVRRDRTTPWGRFLRRTHVDELPQLLGVVRGDLALVGPRPERPVFALRFERAVPGYADRLRVRAGLTGWAQVHGLTGDTSIGDRARFDSQYVEYRSPWLDVVILFRTLAALRLTPGRERVRTPRPPGGRS